jgi:hypothetical protein
LKVDIPELQVIEPDTCHVDARLGKSPLRESGLDAALDDDRQQEIPTRGARRDCDGCDLQSTFHHGETFSGA